jgi:hypothetical protein
MKQSSGSGHSNGSAQVNNMETFELYSLTSKLSMDTGQFDRAYTESRSKMKTLAGEVNKLESAAKSGAGGTNSFGSSLSGLMPSLQGLGGPAGALAIVTVGLGIYAKIIESTATGVWDLTNRFSDMGSQLQDMSDQVNFSVETLGTFQGVGKAVGVEVEQLSTGLVTFQKNLAGGNDALKALGVTSKDNETALRQTFKALSEVNDKTLQTALAADIFGKSGKVMLAIVKETGGNFDEAQEKLRKWNYLMSDDAVAVADEFGDKLAQLGMRFQGIGNTIAMETAPAFIAAFDQISAALDASEVDWRWWGEKLGNIIVNSTALVSGFANAVSKMGATSNPVNFLIDWEAGFEEARQKMNQKREELLQGSGGMMGGRIPGPTIDWKPGGGDGKAKRAAAEKEDPIIRLMEQYQRQLQQLTPMTTEQQIREELLNKEYANSSAQMKAMLIVLGMTIDVKKKEVDATREAAEEQKRGEAAYKAFAEQQFETLRQINHGQMTAYDQARVAMLEFMHVTTPLQQWWVLFNGLLIDAAGTAERLAKALDDIGSIGPGEIKFPEPTGEQPSPDMPPPPKMEESLMLKWRRLVDDFAYDITNTIDRAIQRGFEDGIGAGIKEFGLGILEMARHEALNELAKAMRKALGGGEGEGEESGGGWLSKLISTGVSLVAGLFGGGSSGGLGSSAAGAIGGNASGGFMFPNEWSWVGERGPELVKAGPRGASVMSNNESMGMVGGMAGMTLVQNINVPSMYAAGNRQTQTQALRGLTQVAQRGGYSIRG